MRADKKHVGIHAHAKPDGVCAQGRKKWLYNGVKVSNKVCPDDQRLQRSYTERVPAELSTVSVMDGVVLMAGTILPDGVKKWYVVDADDKVVFLD